MGPTTSAPDADTTTTSRPASLCSSIRETASSNTSGSTMLWRVSATISRTVATSQPATSCDMNCRIFSIWSWSAPPTKKTNWAYADRSSAPRVISPPAWKGLLKASELDLAMIVLSRSKKAAVARVATLVIVGEARAQASEALGHGPPRVHILVTPGVVHSGRSRASRS